MSVRVLYVDIRDDEQVMLSFTVDWHPDMKAEDALQTALSQDQFQSVVLDLRDNNHELIVSWYNLVSEEHSPPGGLGGLDWIIPDKSVLTVLYENSATTNQQIDLSSDWMIHSIEENPL